MKLFVGILALMVYFLTLAYKGSLNAVLTVTFFPQPMNTIQEIADQKLPVGSFTDTFQKAVEASQDDDMQKIASKYFTHYDFDAAFANASSEIVIMAESKQFLEFNLRKRFTNEFGETSMHMTRECFNSYQVAFSVPINSKIKPTLDRKIIQLTEAGLMNYYFKQEMDKAAKKAKSALTQTDANSLSLNHMQAPFYLLPILLMFSLVIFGFEFVYGWHQRRRQQELRRRRGAGAPSK